jgi:predicted enzyme involved in methoxymalonyl-ACP biosynthesis
MYLLDLDNLLWVGIISDDGIEHIQIGSFASRIDVTRLKIRLKAKK